MHIPSGEKRDSFSFGPTESGISKPPEKKGENTEIRAAKSNAREEIIQFIA